MSARACTVSAICHSLIMTAFIALWNSLMQALSSEYLQYLILVIHKYLHRCNTAKLAKLNYLFNLLPSRILDLDRTKAAQAFVCFSFFFFIFLFFFTARCTLAQSAVLRSHVVCLSVCLPVTLVDCDHIGWNSSKIISPLVSLRCSLFATPTWWVCSKGNTPKFGHKVTHPLLIWASETFDRKLRPNGYR